MENSIKVPIFVESRYRVNRKRIKGIVKKLISEHAVSGPIEVSVAIIGDRKMRELSKKYKDEDKTRSILSFSQTEGEQIIGSNRSLKLGDIVLSYPQVINDAVKEEKMVDDKIDELVEHGLMHLLGIHHD